MLHLNKDNFSEEIKTGIVFVKFAVKNGCWPCTEFKAKYEQAENPSAKFCTYERETLPKDNDIDEIEKLYNIRSFPTVLCFENWELKWPVAKCSFFQYDELITTGLNLDIEVAQIRKQLFEKEKYQKQIGMEIQARNQNQQQWVPVVETPKTESEEFPLPAETATTIPVEPCESCT
jgi:hypothetical protein